MAPEVLYRVLFGTTRPTDVQKTALEVQPAILDGYTRHRVEGCDYPAIVPDAASHASVRGTYVTGLTDPQVWRLDVFEGDQYDRVKAKCRLLETGEEVEVETYVWEDKRMGRNGLEIGEWDFEEFRREKMRRWVGSAGEGEYAEVDEAVAKEGKDPTGGRGMDGTMSEKLNGKDVED